MQKSTCLSGSCESFYGLPSPTLQLNRWDAAVALLTAVGTIPVATTTGAPGLATWPQTMGPWPPMTTGEINSRWFSMRTPKC